MRHLGVRRSRMRVFRLRAWIAAYVFGAAATPALPCDSTSCLLQTRGQNGVLAKGAFRLDLSFRYTDQSDPLRGSQSADAAVRPKVDFERGRIRPEYHRETSGIERFTQLDVAYGLSSRAVAQVSLPIWTSRTYDISHFGFSQTYGTSGIGDAQFGVRYAVDGPKRLVAGLALKVPTAKYRSISEFDNGIQEPTLQPGSGSFDIVGSMQYSGPALPGGFTWGASGSYQLNTTNKLDYRFGNDLIGTLNLSRPLAGRLTASLQSKVAHRAHSTYRGENVPSTGATIVYVTPGLRLSLPKALSVYGFAQLPVYRYVNDEQLGPRFSILTGIAKSF